MRIKKRFETEQEYLDYAWSFISFDGKIWRDEDLPKLQPFFEYNHRDDWKPMSEEERESFEYYKKCNEEYSMNLTEIRDSMRCFTSHDFYSFFFLEEPATECYDTDENGNDLDEYGNIIPEESRETLMIDKRKGITFPMVFVGWFDSGFSRAGEESVMFSDFVNL